MILKDLKKVSRALLLSACHLEKVAENKLASLLVVSLDKALNTLNAACISRTHTGWCRPFLSAVFQCVYFPTRKASKIDILLLL